MTSPREIADRYGGDVTGNKARVPTPGHSKNDRGTIITMDDKAPDGVLVHSFNGGDALAIKDQMRSDGLLPKFEPQNRRERKFAPKPIKPVSEFIPADTFDYHNADGELVYQVRRIDRAGDRKEFPVYHPDGPGRWKPGRGGDTVLYRLRDILSAPLDAVIFMVEGERHADKLAAWGFPATSSKNLPDNLKDIFEGRMVAILPDHDEEGDRIAAKAKNALEAAGATCFNVTLPGLPEKGDILDWDGSVDELVRITAAAQDSEAAKLVAEKPISATPYRWPDPSNIPLRDWIAGNYILRGEATIVLSPGGIGKTTLLVGTAMSMASGIEFLGIKLWTGAKRVWLMSLEDDRSELERAIAAAILLHNISPNEFLFVDSGLDQRICTASETDNRLVIHEPVYDALKAEILDRGIDVIIIDPFVSSHEISDNDNVKIDAVAKRWKRLAIDAGCAVVLVHHSRKNNNSETTVEDSRGASSLMNAARIGLTLNRMSKTEAQGFGITEQAERRSIFRVDNGKANRSPAGNAAWFKIESVDIGNGTDNRPADMVGAVASWTPPDPFDNVTTEHLRQVQAIVADGGCRGDPQAKDWVGNVVAEVIGLDLDDPADKAKAKSILKTWEKNGKFKTEIRKDRNRKDRPFVAVGEATL